MPFQFPDAVAEVRVAFHAYEAALVANDLAALSSWFSDGDDVVRFAFGDIQLGAAAVARARRSTPVQTAPRTVEQLELRAWSPDVVSAFAVCRLDESGEVVHQSQVWVRMARQWRVCAAHVSWA